MGSTEKITRYGAKDVITKNVSIISVVGMFYGACCAGAFGIEEMVPESGPGLTLLMLMVLPFVWALPYGFICAELGSARPVEGGSMIWVQEALGEYWFGLMVIICFIWSLISNTVYVVLSINYLGKQIELTDTQAYMLKIGLILVFFLINVLGIKEVSAVSTFIAVFVLVAFVLVTVIGFANYDHSPFIPFANPDYNANPLMAVGAALGLGLWMYSGYDEISIFAGEIENAGSVIPKALMIVIPLIALTYILPTAAGLSSVGQWEYWTTEPDGIGYHTVFEFSPIAPAFLSVFFLAAAILGNCANFNMVIASASRCGMILADENFGPKPLGKLSSKRGTPLITLIVIAIATAALLGTPSNQVEFTFLVLFDAFFYIVVVALTVTAALILKRRIPDEEVPFKTPGGRMGHNIMAGCVYFFCLLFAFLNGTDYYLGGLGIMLVMPVIYAICKRVWKGTTPKDPQLYPLDTRTGLAFGDITRMGGYYLGLGLFSVVARFFLQWYEENEYVGYWASKDEIGWWEVEVIRDYPELIRENPLTGSRYIPGYYETEYGSGPFADLYTMLDLIFYIGIGSAVVGVVLLLWGKRLKATEI